MLPVVEKISELCVDLLRRIHAADKKEIDLDEIMENAETKEVPVNTWEEFVVAASTIAENHAFKRSTPVDECIVNMERSRNKLIDLFVQLL